MSAFSRVLFVVMILLVGIQSVWAQSLNSPVDTTSTVQVLITPEETVLSKDRALEIVEEALEISNPQYDIQKEITDTVFLATIDRDDFADLQDSPEVVIQKNEYRTLFTSAEVLSLVGADVARSLPYSAVGSGYATVIIDTGVRATHNFFTTLGTAFHATTNPSRVTLEHCQSGGLPLVDGLGSYILDGLGNRLYEGISLCNGNVSAPTVINGVTYYSNSIAGTVVPSFGASAPCLAEYPGFDSGCRHGSHVAGIAAGTAANYSDTIYSGIAPASSIISFNVFTKYTDPSICGGSAPCLAATDADILSALSQVEELAVAGEKIGSVNMSLGGSSYTNQSQCDQNNLLYYYAFQRLRTLGIPVVVATGNNGYTNRISSPGCVSTAYGVGATTITSPGVDAIASYSNIASFIEYLAPGTSLVSANVSDQSSFYSLSGTSMATPIVAGAFTVLRSLFDGTHSPYPYRSLDTIANALTVTGIALDDNRSGGVVDNIPRINIGAAAAQLAQMPYIVLPNQSAINITYPLLYTFQVSSGVAILVNNITIHPSSTVVRENFSCTALSPSSYECSVSILSDGNIILSVTDTSAQTYTTPAQVFSTLPTVDAITTTTPTGTYSTGTIIPIVAHITGIDSALQSGSRVVATLNNGVSLTLTAPESSSNTLTGSYTIGTLGSGQTTAKLQVASISSAVLTELDGTIYTNTMFTPGTVGTNLDQSGKVISVDVTTPAISSATLSQVSNSSQSVVPTGTIVLTLITNKASASSTITINNALPTAVTQINTTTIQATKVVQPGDLGSVTFSARVSDQFGNTSPTITSTTDGSFLNMEPPTAMVSSGGGGGGGGSATPAILPTVDKVAFCSTEITSPLIEGSSAISVFYAETALQVAGFFGSLPNLDYNSGTTLAVKNFQTRYSPSHVTGVVDTQTWKLLQFYGGCGTNDNKKVPTTTSIQSNSYPELKKTIKAGERSPLVTATHTLLAKLGYLKPAKKPSTLMSTSLMKTIKLFQKQNKIPVTGKIDKATYTLLLQLVK